MGFTRTDIRFLLVIIFHSPDAVQAPATSLHSPSLPLKCPVTVVQIGTEHSAFPCCQWLLSEICLHCFNQCSAGFIFDIIQRKLTHTTVQKETLWDLIQQGKQ